MRDRIFYSICFGFVFGVLLRSFVFINIYFAIFFAALSAIFILFFTVISKRNFGIIFSVFILTFSFGIFRFHLADKSAPIFPIEAKVSFSGILIDEPDIRENNQKLNIEVDIGEEKTKILATVGFEENFKYGDEVKFLGKLQKPQNFLTDTGKEFDYINYLRKDGILYISSYPEIEIVSRRHGNFIKRFLFSAKEKFLAKMNFAIPEPESLLMGGLILGEKSAFSEELREDFVRTGTIHIVALSGYNVTIVAEWFMKLFSFLPFMWSIGAGIFAILLFVLMTGGSSTALRAGIMATLALVARATGRNYDVARALALAGVLMIIFNPFVLVYDVSFQLSFIATVAVIFLAPKIEKHFTWITERFGLRDIVSVTCAAYIFVLPFILYKMGNLSLVALPANILVLPFIPITMVFGFLTGFFGLIWNMLALPFGYISYLLLHYELGIIQFLSNIPFASFSVSNFPLTITILIYVYFAYRLFGKDIKNFFIHTQN